MLRYGIFPDVTVKPPLSPMDLIPCPMTSGSLVHSWPGHAATPPQWATVALAALLAYVFSLTHVWLLCPSGVGTEVYNGLLRATK